MRFFNDDASELIIAFGLFGDCLRVIMDTRSFFQTSESTSGVFIKCRRPQRYFDH